MKLRVQQLKLVTVAACATIGTLLWFTTSCNPPPAPPPPGTAVLIAEKTIHIGKNDSVTGGDVVIRQIEPWTTADGGISTAISIAPDGGTPTTPPQPQLVVDQGANVGIAADCTTGAGTVSASSISLAKTGCIGHAQTNALTSDGASAATQTAFPTAPLRPLPLGPLPGVGTSNVTVSPGSSMSLSPGNYGVVTVGHAATLTFASGNYSLQQLVVDANATVTTSAACGVAILTSTLTDGDHSTIAAATGCTAKDLFITIAETAPVNIGQHTTVHALLAAPHADLNVEKGATVRGALAAFDITLMDSIDVAFEDGFPASRTGTQQLSGYYVQRLDGSHGAIAPVPRNAVFELDIGLSTPNPGSLTAAVRAVSDPNSPQFRQYLTPTTFAAQFGASPTDYTTLIQWAVAHGFTIQQKFENRLLLSVTGTVAQVESAFYVNLMYRIGGMHTQGFLAVDREPSLGDPTLPGQGGTAVPTISAIAGFDDYATVSADCANVNNGSTSGAGGTFSAADIRQAYLGPTNSPHPNITTTNCLTLDGAGQTVAILALEGYDQNHANLDRSGFIALQPQGPPFLPFNNGSVTVFPQGAGPNVNGLQPPIGETALDMQAVTAMAPAAKIKIYEIAADINGHHSNALFTIAGDPEVNIVSVSWEWNWDNGAAPPEEKLENTALEQMVMDGVSYFTSSGDSGDTTPHSNLKLEDQMIVGGTALSGTLVQQTQAAGLVYATPYWGGEKTWNDQCYPPNGGITGGGVLSVSTPWYQQNIPNMSQPAVVLSSGLADPTQGNGGLAVGMLNERAYPDISALASASFLVMWNDPWHCRENPDPPYDTQCYQVTCVPWGQCSPNDTNPCCANPEAGTSLSTPLWAGYAALVNQQAAVNQVHPLGFGNPTFYAIGRTRGLGPGLDIYSSTFHDINDGVWNAFPYPSKPPTLSDNEHTGFPSVDGYDLATGWGSPSCLLLSVLSSNRPTFPQTYPDLYVSIQSGWDGLDDTSGLTLTIAPTSNAPFSSPFDITLKPHGEGHWDRGQVHEFSMVLPTGVPPLSQLDVASVSLTMDQGNRLLNTDNFNVGGLQVRLTAPGSGLPSACLVDVSGSEDCDHNQPSCNANGSLGDTLNNNTGVTRLSANNDCANCTTSSCGCGSGQGHTATFNLVGNNMRGQPIPDVGSCLPWNGAPASQPFDRIEFIVDTDDDDLKVGSTASVLMQDPASHNVVPLTAIDSGSVGLANDTEFSVILTPISPPPNLTWTMAQIRNGTITLAFTPNGTDEWHVNGVHVVGRRGIAGGQDTCLFDWHASPDGSGGVTAQKIVYNSSFPNGSQNGVVPTFTIGAGCP
jgi:hypothetical protein